jgi:hypothetical protein
MYSQQSQSPQRIDTVPSSSPRSLRNLPRRKRERTVSGVMPRISAARGAVTWIAVVRWSCKGFMTKRTLKHHPWRVQSLSGGAQHVGEALSNDTSMARVGYLQNRLRSGY